MPENVKGEPGSFSCMAAIIEQINLNEKKGVACVPVPFLCMHGRHFYVERVDF
ncbi:MAG TPA: hypothetical protein PLT33_02675 [Deltaproteobacteria bacterium]|nr:MAG: hypothetical protein BWX71_02213 [Deltaproteobacteria bacterium ADurb.Bin072]HQO59755.1 hypothetical protein [Deltaproteobacteria bacterium]